MDFITKDFKDKAASTLQKNFSYRYICNEEIFYVQILFPVQ